MIADPVESRMKDKTIVITGATSGIGRVAAQSLAELGAKVVMVGRDQSRCEETVSQIQQTTENPEVEYQLAEFSSLKEVHQLSERLQETYDRIDVLINNAGAYYLRRKVSLDGFEMTLAVNHLASFLLTLGLLPRLQTSAPSRIINVASALHERTQIDFDDLQGERRYSGMRAYSQSKLANILFAYELDRRYRHTGISANALHPGFVATNLGSNNGWWMQLVLPIIHLSAISPERGAQNTIYLASAPEFDEISGQYFIGRQAVPSSPESNNTATAEQLWKVSEELTEQWLPTKMEDA